MTTQAHPVILFAGTPLSNEAYWLELIPSIVPEISDDARDWTLDLHYCTGRSRKAKSKAIIRYCNELSRAIDTRGAILRQGLADRLPTRDAEEVICSWRSLLESIRVLAADREECVWSAPSAPSDAKKAGKALSFLFEAMAQRHPKVDASKEREAVNRLADATDESALQVLHDVLDGMTTRSCLHGRRRKRK
jgi:hypothetical protein